MAEKRKKDRGRATQAQAATTDLSRAFSQKNLLLFVIALVVIVIGHIALGMGSITFAPICLVVGYCILVPLAIII
ncbi:MAG: hypothetical protein FVQ81_08930 [Candidatus Glassbacteria bacterium]|nr:hypothetical protein [Candidatus Glassbacteria bacterium]